MQTPADLKLAEGFAPATREAWMKLVDKAIKGGDFEKRLVSRTADGLRIEPIYTRANELSGSAAAAPFTRGSGGQRMGFGWDIRQFHAEADPKAANAAILEDLAGGATSIALQIAAPGISGLPVAGIKSALDGVILDMCPVSLTAFDATTAAADALFATWGHHGIPKERRLGHLNADPLGRLAIFGALPEGLDIALADAARLAQRTQAMPGVTALVADGAPYHAAGATEAQELAAVLATLVADLRACEAAGLEPKAALPKIAVNVTADADQFLTIAKLRALRRLIWRVADASGAAGATAAVKVSAVTAYRMMAKRDPWTNMLRTTIACAAAALGGADAITVLPFTFALGRPDAFARRIARNTQIVLQEESGLGRVVDPAGGSWYVEKLTDDLAHAAWKVFQEIEAEGGMAAALKSGHVQDMIQASADARAKAIATGRQELTGVSAFPLLADDGVTAEPWPAPATPRPAGAQIARPLAMRRLGEAFEALRDGADTARAAGREPKVFLASLGAIADHTLRSTWIKNYLAAGGIAALTSDGYADAAAAAKAFADSGVGAACICSSDAVYAEHAEATAKALKAAGAKIVLMAGRAGDREAALRAAGVDQFLFAGADAVATLTDLQRKLA